MWLIVSIVCLIVELIGGNMFMICLSVGALATALFAWCGVGIYIDIVIFAILSVVSIIFVRPLMLKYFYNKERKSNADALINRIGKVVEPIEKDGYGRVAIDGDVWKAKTVDGMPLEKDKSVKVVERESIIITVVELEK